MFWIPIFIGLVISLLIIRWATPERKVGLFVYSLIPFVLFVLSCIFSVFFWSEFYAIKLAAKLFIPLVLSSILVPCGLYKKMKNNNKNMVDSLFWLYFSVAILSLFLIVEGIKMTKNKNSEKTTTQLLYSIIRNEYLAQFQSEKSDCSIYKNNGKIYALTRGEVIGLLSKYPNSEKLYECEDTTYCIPVSKIDNFERSSEYEKYIKHLYSRINDTTTHTITYIVNGEIYDIPEDRAFDFETKYPDATQEYKLSNGDRYAIPLSIRAEFESSPMYKKDREDRKAYFKNIAFYIYKGVEYKVPKNKVEEFERIVPESYRYYKDINRLVSLKDRKDFEKKNGLIPKNLFEIFIEKCQIFIYSYWIYIAISFAAIFALFLLIRIYRKLRSEILKKYIGELKKKEFKVKQAKLYLILKVMAIICLFILLYLFALNGRYEDNNGYFRDFIFDKWKGKYIKVDDSMIIKNK